MPWSTYIFPQLIGITSTRYVLARAETKDLIVVQKQQSYKPLVELFKRTFNGLQLTVKKNPHY